MRVAWGCLLVFRVCHGNLERKHRLDGQPELEREEVSVSLLARSKCIRMLRSLRTTSSSLSLSHRLSVCLSLALVFSLAQPLPLSLSGAHAHTHNLSVSLSLPLPLSSLPLALSLPSGLHWRGIGAHFRASAFLAMAPGKFHCNYYLCSRDENDDGDAAAAVFVAITSTVVSTTRRTTAMHYT